MFFLVKTLGCKVNNCDSQEISIDLISKGFKFTLNENDADVIIINSCAVTIESVRKTCQIIRRFKRMKNDLIIVLTGCASIIDDIKKMKEIDILVENSQKSEIFNEISSFFLNKKINNDVTDLKGINPEPKFKTRAFLKIEDGCQNFCSYCIIPLVRGNIINSVSLVDIKKKVDNFYSKKYKEIILVGINICAYGQDLNCNLYDAIEIASEKFNRIRLGSLDPYFFVKNEEILDKIIKNKNLAPSFHFSLQSGSDKILKLMNRKYTQIQYLNIIKKIKERITNATFTTDVIVGFPGETEEDFDQTINTIKVCNFIKVNVFPFSERPGTKAFFLKNKVENSIKNQRVKEAILFSEKISKNVTKNFVGKEFDLLIEKKISKNVYVGYTENYIKCTIKSDKNLLDDIIKICL